MSRTSCELGGLEPMTLVNSNNLAGAFGGKMRTDRGGRLSVATGSKYDSVGVIDKRAQSKELRPWRRFDSTSAVMSFHVPR